MYEQSGEFIYRPSKPKEYVARLHRVSTGSILEVSVEANSEALATVRVKKMYPGWNLMEIQWSWGEEWKS